MAVCRRLVYKAAMKIPKRLQPLVEDGLIDAVVRQLKSGKEAAVFIVRSGDTLRCAKEKHSRYGRKQQEEAWQNAEVDALYRLASAGVRVPQPYGYFDGVLLMELVTGDEGHAAPRLDDLQFTAARAQEYYQFLVRQVVRMLCAGVIHGELSEYNVLVDDSGPVIIDLPQAVDAAGNNNAFRMLWRDVNNLTAYFGRYEPAILATDYGREIWDLYERGLLHPDVELTGRFTRDEQQADIDSVMKAIEAAREEAERRREGANHAESADGSPH